MTFFYIAINILSQKVSHISGFILHTPHFLSSSIFYLVLYIFLLCFKSSSSARTMFQISKLLVNKHGVLSSSLSHLLHFSALEHKFCDLYILFWKPEFINVNKTFIIAWPEAKTIRFFGPECAAIHESFYGFQNVQLSTRYWSLKMKCIYLQVNFVAYIK